MTQTYENGNGAAAPSLDPLDDLDALRLPQDFEDSIGVKKLITQVPVKKPNKQTFVRVNPDPAYAIDVPIVELKDDREVYLVTAAMRAAIPGGVVSVRLYTTISRQGVLTLWPARLPSADGRQNSWHVSAHAAAAAAMKHWVRIEANMAASAYDVNVALGQLPDPEWPDLSFKEIINLAFTNNVIKSVDHPVVRRLLGVV